MRFHPKVEALEPRTVPTVVTVDIGPLLANPLPGMTAAQEKQAVEASLQAWANVVPIQFELTESGPASITLEGGNALGWLALTYGAVPSAVIVLDTSHYRFYGLPETAAQQGNPSEPLVETLLHEEANALALPETFSDPSYTTSRAVQGHDWPGPASVAVKLYPQEQASLAARYGTGQGSVSDDIGAPAPPAGNTAPAPAPVHAHHHHHHRG